MLSFFSSKTSESMTRLVFFLFAVSVIFWQSWCIIVTKGSVPNLLEILGFMAGILGWKQYTEVKSASTINPQTSSTGNQ